MKFSKKDHGPFFQSLNEKVNVYLQSCSNGKYANSSIWIKGLVLIGIYCGSYVLLLNTNLNTATQIILLAALGFSGVMIVFNLVHDASHNTLFKNKTVNRSIAYLGDLAGINTYIWDIRHNVQHHTFTNILDGDIIIDNIPLVRLSPYQKYFPVHRYQLWYAPFFYLLYTLYWMFFIDFKLFFKTDICNLKNIRHPKTEWIKLILFKSFYIFYTVVVPSVFFHFTFSKVLAGFFIMHLFAGLLLSTIALLGHFVEGPSFVKPLPDGNIPNSWMQHEFDATIDFSTNSKLMHCLTGGLNTHIAHHLYPRICHCHYFQLSKIIKQHCTEHQVTYPQHSFNRAIVSHFRYLKKLSRPVVAV